MTTTPPEVHASRSVALRLAPPLASTGLTMVGAGLLGALLPLRYSAAGLSAGTIGLLGSAEGLGFLVGCLHAHRIIAPVGSERAYATFAGLKSVAILGLFFAVGAPWIAVLRFLIGLNAAGLSVVVESWLNALSPNEQRGRILTVYVLVYGLCFGFGELLGRDLDASGPQFLLIAGIATTLALVPMAAVEVRAPARPHRVNLQVAKALRTSPVSVLACLLNGLILTAFTTAGPLFGERLGLDQARIVLLMASFSMGSLLLQWPIGYLSDRIDRLYALIGLGAAILGVAGVLIGVSGHTPFVVLVVLLAVFGGLGESLYAVGVAHANDRAPSRDYIALSSTLLFVWALGAAIGPTTGTIAIERSRPGAFFAYVLGLTVLFTVFALWRLARRRTEPVEQGREEFLTYPQTSPEIYSWIPYHRGGPEGEAAPPDGEGSTPVDAPP
ncbi:MAG: MFS transporter [Gammaproteobacteria bacterium]|nr:MFS transporter [Gammaproteobacteria bacterium]